MLLVNSGKLPDNRLLERSRNDNPASVPTPAGMAPVRALDARLIDLYTRPAAVLASYHTRTGRYRKQAHQHCAHTYTQEESNDRPLGMVPEKPLLLAVSSTNPAILATAANEPVNLHQHVV